MSGMEKISEKPEKTARELGNKKLSIEDPPSLGLASAEKKREEYYKESNLLDSFRKIIDDNSSNHQSSRQSINMRASKE